MYFATAELALDKYDNALAAETLQAAPKSLAEDPQYHYLLARAFAADDPARAQAAIEAALAINPNHVDSLLLRIDRLIDAEEYIAAESQLERVLASQSESPEGLGLQSCVGSPCLGFESPKKRRASKPSPRGRRIRKSIT